MISQKTLEVIRAITPVVAQHAEAITRVFYEKMFHENPEVRVYFNPAHQFSGGQQKALAASICAYFSNIDNPAALEPAINLIAHKHCSLGIQPEHYPIVGKHLIVAIKEVLGDAVTEEIVEAVTEAYLFLADVLIEREKAIYTAHRESPGGWENVREFVIDRKVKENAEISSFYLRPADGLPILNFQEGQYLTVKIEHPEQRVSPRNYSISSSNNGEHYRISVKKEIGAVADRPAGVVSNYLHDQLEVGDILNVGPPCGEFTICPDDVHEKRPIVFLAGGIGMTPLLSMATSLVRQKVKNQIVFIQATRNGESQAFREELAELSQNHENFRYLTIFSEPTKEDFADRNHDCVGFINQDLIEETAPVETASYYFCGPSIFMKMVFQQLKTLGVSEDRMKFEFFGPREEVTSAALSNA